MTAARLILWLTDVATASHGSALAEIGWRIVTGLPLPAPWPVTMVVALGGLARTLNRLRNHLTFARQEQLIGCGYAAADRALPAHARA